MIVVIAVVTVVVVNKASTHSTRSRNTSLPYTVVTVPLNNITRRASRVAFGLAYRRCDDKHYSCHDDSLTHVLAWHSSRICVTRPRPSTNRCVVKRVAAATDVQSQLANLCLRPICLRHELVNCATNDVRDETTSASACYLSGCGR